MEATDVSADAPVGRAALAAGTLLRRWIFASCVIGTTVALTWLLVMTVGPLDVPATILVGAFLGHTTWVALAFWNALLGFFCIRQRKPALQPSQDAIVARIAIVMATHNEDGSQSILRLRAVKHSVDAGGFGHMFDYYLLSDSSTAQSIASEEAAFSVWQTEEPESSRRIHYRRRSSNWGFKPGNIRDFCAQYGTPYEYFILLDADSLMDGATIERMIRMMQSDQKLGILQTMIVGTLCPSLFARAFEFGHRHSLRCSVAGAAWWQDDRCQYWGHNAAIRLRPFADFCEMPYLPGKGPFSGHVICHDQIEASFMHREGFEVRVLAEESGSYEGVPPTLIDFLKRNHRWCRGNLKNLKLLGASGMKLIDRVHLAIVAQRFLAYPTLALFILAAAWMAVRWPATRPFPEHRALALYGIWLALLLGPRILGIADALLTSPSRYGGVLKLLIGGLAELVFTFIVTAICAVETTVFIAKLPFEHVPHWIPQRRDGYSLSWRDSFEAFWPLPTIAVALLVAVGFFNSAAIIWFAPFIVALMLAVPLVKVTAAPNAGIWLYPFPEERDVPPVIADFLRMRKD